jgi:hypothetical protein
MGEVENVVGAGQKLKLRQKKTFSFPHASAAPPETPAFRARRRFRECLVVVPAPAR